MRNFFSLSQKRIIVTGAGGFFGRHFVLGLIEAGAKMIYALDYDQDRLEHLLDDLDDAPEVRTFVVNQYDDQETLAICKRISGAGPIDVVINNSFDWKSSGFGDPLARLESISHPEVMNGLASGTWWPIAMTQPFIAGMKEKGEGVIINISSMYGVVAPNPSLYEGRDYFNPVNYGMSKAAILALTRYMAAWLGPEIRANALVPGAIPNFEKDSDNSSQNRDEEFIARLTERTLVKRLGHPYDDLVGPLVFLASDASRYMTGQALVIDGGWTVT